jgi:RHS repeat-associated protein
MNLSKAFKQAMVAVLSFAIAGGPALAARTTTYFHTDRAGSVVAATNEAGVVLSRKDYAPFGEQLNSPPGAERTSYTGKQHDDVIGLTHFGARWFDPEIGRFTGVDPVSFVEQRTMSFNRYLYAYDNPYKFVDPDGRLGYLIAVAVVLIGLVASDAANTPIPGEITEPVGGAARFFGEGVLGLSPLLRPATSFPAGVPEGIVYKRMNPKTGECYIGQCKSQGRYDARQGEHDRALNADHKYEQIGRAKPGKKLDVLEESKIREHGGLKREGGRLENKRHQMSEKNYRENGGKVDDPNR